MPDSKRNKRHYATNQKKRRHKLHSNSKRDHNARLGSAHFDWAKFTNFRSRSTRKDLERLFEEIHDKSKRKELLERPDGVGLYPIHWAAINNRSDFIEVLFREGSSLTKRCHNRLFANGTPLHLAAMNGSLEAAAILLRKGHELEMSRTRPKSVEPAADAKARDEKESPPPRTSLNQPAQKIDRMLAARDADGQTPLMRAAAPRTKHMNTIWDLLRKNFWSLSGRPAEMALFLICMGADWRQTEPVNGMNLLHLAIMNNYDDIVCLLLVLDKDLLEVPTTPSGSDSSQRENQPKKAQQSGQQTDGFEAITLNSPSNASSQTEQPLINSRHEQADELLARGLRPLQLAVLYGRVSIISLLWRPGALDGRQGENVGEKSPAEIENSNRRELKKLLVRACLSNKDELANFLKPALLKGALALDLALLVLIWAPIYCYSTVMLTGEDLALTYDDYATQDQSQGSAQRRSVLMGLKGGVFLLSLCASMALALRVMLKNPAFLRRHSVHYLSELSRLLGGSRTKRTTQVALPGDNKTDSQDGATSNKQKGRSPLIKLDQTTSIVVGVKQLEEQQTQTKQEPPPDPQRSGKVVLAMDSPDATSGEYIRELQHKVRLLCHKCQCIRRPRSKHCNYCNHCVQDFDHHCIYLGCCIGRNNRLDFLMVMVALSITGLYGTLVQTTSMRRLEWSRFWHLLAFVWVFKYFLIGSLTAYLQLRRASLGVTLYEWHRSQRLRDMFGHRGPPAEICRSHETLSNQEDAFWRFSPTNRLLGELPTKQLLANFREFTNYTTPDEYLLTFICTDTPLARSLDSRAKQQMYKLA